MAQLGRLDVYFSTMGDQELWDFISQCRDRERGYWLKYYAKLGLKAAQNGLITAEIPVPELLNNTQSTNNKTSKCQAPKKQRRKKETTNANQPEIPKSNPEETTSGALEGLSLEIRKVDPAEKRRQAMGNLLSADPRLLNVINDDSNTDENN